VRRPALYATAALAAVLPSAMASAAPEDPALGGWYAAIAKGDAAAAAQWLAEGATLGTYLYGRPREVGIEELVAFFRDCTLKESGPGVGWLAKPEQGAIYQCPKVSTEYDHSMELTMAGGKIAGILYYADAVATPAPPGWEGN
jgi:hypothetical protein